MEHAETMRRWSDFTLIVHEEGTDLHTSLFYPEMAATLRTIVARHRSFIKGPYIDWIDNTVAYPASGVCGANVEPEFTAEEEDDLRILCACGAALARFESFTPSRFFEPLTDAVLESGRWRKWLRSDEPNDFEKLTSGLQPFRKSSLPNLGQKTTT